MPRPPRALDASREIHSDEGRLLTTIVAQHQLLASAELDWYWLVGEPPRYSTLLSVLDKDGARWDFDNELFLWAQADPDSKRRRNSVDLLKDYGPVKLLSLVPEEIEDV